MDVEFPLENVPSIYSALNVTEKNLTMEVQQQIGGGVVRCIAMGASEGLRRGLEVTDTQKSNHSTSWYGYTRPYHECTG